MSSQSPGPGRLSAFTRWLDRAPSPVFVAVAIAAAAWYFSGSATRFLAVLETLDNGKPIKETRDVDLPLVAAHFFHHAGWADKLEYAGYGPNPQSIGVAGCIYASLLSLDNSEITACALRSFSYASHVPPKCQFRGHRRDEQAILGSSARLTGNPLPPGRGRRSLACVGD